MLERDFQILYEGFRKDYYEKLFSQEKDGKNILSSTDMFCAETIFLLKNPTYTEIARFWNVSKSNANYKINTLIKKGYITKKVSPKDKREYHLSVTDKFLEYYMANNSRPIEFISVVREVLSKEEIKMLEDFMLRVNQAVEKRGNK